MMMSAEEKYDDDQLRILLEEAGLESVPFDPVSLEALRELITAARTCRQEEEELEQDEAVDSWLTQATAAAVDAAAATTTTTSTTTNTPDFNKFKTKWHLPPKEGPAWQHLVQVEDKPFAPLAGATEVENKIAELLHTQTKMLISMSRRIDELTAKVDQLTHGTASSSTSNNNQQSSSNILTASTRTTTAPRYTTPTAFVAEAKVTTDRIHRPTPPPPPAAAAAPIPPPVNDGPLPWHIKVYRIALLFVQLRRRHVQELDGGLIFKILFMMAILTARMSGHSSSSKKHGDADWHAKFAALVVVVLMGFLVQTGYIKYCYIFFVKEQYPARIWNGDVTVEDILNNNDHHNNRINNNNNPNNHHHGLPRGPLPPNQRDNNNNNPAQPPQPQGWRNTFLGGLIPEANPEQQQQQGAGAAALGVLQDVALLLGSFLMSIFPMWHPEGPPRRPPPLNEQAPPPPPQQPVQQQQGMAAPGVVQPPRNAMQPVEDDDDDDDNNQ